MGDLGIENFNPEENAKNAYKPNLLPDGTYECIIVKASAVNTKDFTGKYLDLELCVLDDGEYKNRKVFDKIHFKNRNPDFQLRQLGILGVLSLACKATGENASEYEQKIVKVKVSTEEGKNGYGPKNRVDKYMAAGDGAATAGKVDEPPF